MSLVSQVVEYLDTRPDGASLREILAALQHAGVRNGISAAANSGLIVSVRGRWHRTSEQLVHHLAREQTDLDAAEARAASDRRFAALIGDQRFEDVRFRPLPLRALHAEPNATLIGCAANMCAYR
jgi:hypothetical protein